MSEQVNFEAKTNIWMTSELENVSETEARPFAFCTYVALNLGDTLTDAGDDLPSSLITKRLGSFQWSIGEQKDMVQLKKEFNINFSFITFLEYIIISW